MSFLQSLVIAACFAAVSQAFIVTTVGRCPNIPTKPDFELNKYLGLWFSYENFDAPFQWGSTCVRALYSIKPDGNIRVINAGYWDIRLYGRTIYRSPIRIEGQAFIVDQKQPGGINVRFGNQPNYDASKPNYLIIDTDYNSYSVVYSCTQDGIFKTELAWILTRGKGQRPANLDALEANLESYGIKTVNFKRVDHSNC